MTEPKYIRMGKLEKFYIEQNWKKLTVDQLSNDTKVQKRSINKLIEKLKVAEDKSNAAAKLAEPKTETTTTINAANNMLQRKGIAIMTKDASELGDALRSRTLPALAPDRVTTIR